MFGNGTVLRSSSPSLAANDPTRPARGAFGVGTRRPGILFIGGVLGAVWMPGDGVDRRKGGFVRTGEGSRLVLNVCLLERLEREEEPAEGILKGGGGIPSRRAGVHGDIADSSISVRVLEDRRGRVCGGSFYSRTTLFDLEPF